jgi:hypothetical protein
MGISKSYLKELAEKRKYQSGGFSTQDKQFSVKKSTIPGANKGLFSKTPIKQGKLIGLAHENNQPVGTLGNMHNHSETPNMQSVKVGNQRYVYATRDIQPGEELTTNYRLQPELEQPEDFMGNKRFGQFGLSNYINPKYKNTNQPSLNFSDYLPKYNPGTSTCPKGYIYDSKKRMCVPEIDFLSSRKDYNITKNYDPRQAVVENRKYYDAYQYMQDYYNSPRYKEMLRNSAKDEKDYASLLRDRNQALSTTPALKIKSQPEDDPRVGGSSYTHSGQIEIYPEGFNTEGTAVHELSHSSDRPTFYLLENQARSIPQKDIDYINKNKAKSFYESRDYFNLLNQNQGQINPGEDEFWNYQNENFKNFYTNYVGEPTETRARLNAIRQGAKQNNLYDPFTEKVTPSIFYKKLKNFKFEKGDKEGFNPMDQLKKLYSDEEIMWMLNNISKNESPQTEYYGQKGFYKPDFRTKSQIANAQGQQRENTYVKPVVKNAAQLQRINQIQEQERQRRIKEAADRANGTLRETNDADREAMNREDYTLLGRAQKLGRGDFNPLVVAASVADIINPATYWYAGKDVGRGVGQTAEGIYNLDPNQIGAGLTQAGLGALSLLPAASEFKPILRRASGVIPNQLGLAKNIGNIFSKKPLSQETVDLMRFLGLPELKNPQATNVLENFMQRINTPEGANRLKQLGITNTDFLKQLKIVEDENTLAHYWYNRIGINPKLPEMRRVTRHEIEHGVQEAKQMALRDKYTQDLANLKYLFRPKARKEALAQVRKPTTEIDDLLSGLELRKTPQNVNWNAISTSGSKKEPQNLFDYMSDKQRATNYFASGSEGREKSAFLAEVQEYMMENGIIPQTSYVKITPEMVKNTFVDAMFDEQGGGKYLRLFNIMKPTETNYKLIADGLNKMLGAAPYAIPAGLGVGYMMQNQKPKGTYQGGGTKDDASYMNFVRTLPSNLAQPNDPSYNLRGYWNALGNPESFDYNQPTDPQGYYHAFSRDPRTGQILKAPFHPSFKEGVNEEGAYRLVNPRGDIYTQGFKYPAYEGPYALPRMDQSYDFLDKPDYEGYFDGGGKKRKVYKPDFRSKSQIAAEQGNTGESTKVASKINPVSKRLVDEANYERLKSQQPSFNQGYKKTASDIERSDYYKKQQESKNALKNALRNVDVVTDVMQVGNFIPHPIAQGIGQVGNWLGAATDVTQAGMDYGNQNYGGMGINLASAMVPTVIGAASFRRNSKYLRPGQTLYPFSPQAGILPGGYSRVSYIEPFNMVKGMTKTNLMANRALLGTLGVETAYDAGAFDNNTRLGLPINMQKPNYAMGGTMGIPGVNGQVVSSGPGIKDDEGNVKTMSSKQVKQTLKYSRYKPNKI